MTDQEIVDGLINRDEKITDWFFNIKYRPLFINVIKLIFDYQVDYDECISELYYHLMKNDAAVLRNFEGRSTIGTWIKIVAIRFFREQKKREQMIEDESKEPHAIGDTRVAGVGCKQLPESLLAHGKEWSCTEGTLKRKTRTGGIL